MEELLKLSPEELLKNERVIKAYWGVQGYTEFKHNLNTDKYPSYTCNKCGKEYIYGINASQSGIDLCPVIDPIQVSIYQAAFEMRDACPARGYMDALAVIHDRDHMTSKLALILLQGLCPELMVIAATLCWEEICRRAEKI